ncbi:hypothetical protein M9H77_03098 [Catharanthus roseus]|uniref:Uncharacterized protein n=1 Tax=Catharanthus roseus TaxID=4058 RepID=A0ACC0CAF6_CATRO|nr:hypothetical protein M9H77_03098 [Catharanthus roseus]
MAHSEEISALIKAFTGLGVDEKSLISILGKWRPQQIESYRKASNEFFIEDERQFQRWNEKHIQQLQQDFIRFKNAVVLRTMHPWERDARLLKEDLVKEPPQFNVIIEIACTRSSEELLGARRAYHSLFNQSIEEHISSHLRGVERRLLVALVSAYRYEGPNVNEERAKYDAKIFHDAIKGAGKKDLLQDEKIIMILATRSKSHIKALYKYYKEFNGKDLDEDIDGAIILKQAIQCLCIPNCYFSQVLDASLNINVDEIAKDSVARVIVTRADVDMKYINAEFEHKYKLPLPKKIAEVANGNYKDLLLALVEREN